MGTAGERLLAALCDWPATLSSVRPKSCVEQVRAHVDCQSVASIITSSAPLRVAYPSLTDLDQTHGSPCVSTRDDRNERGSKGAHS